MKKELSQAFQESSTLTHVKIELLNLFDSVKKDRGASRIGYVAGIITSDGEEHMQKNIDGLAKWTESVRSNVDFPIFSATEIFGNGMYQRIEDFHLKKELREKTFINFWRDVLTSGHITDIYMTPRWQESKGAKDEHETARRVGIEIHYVE